MGKALGGGIYPVSAIAADHDDHGRHHARLARLDLRRQPAGRRHRHRGRRDARGGHLPGPLAVEIGAQIEAGFRPLVGHGLLDVRVRGAWAGIDIDPALMTGRVRCRRRLMDRGILAKDTHGSTVRFAPPLVASDDDIAGLVTAVTEILAAG